MKRQLRAVFLAVSLVYGLANAQNPVKTPESFLAQPVHTTWLQYSSYTDLLGKLRGLVPKPIVVSGDVEKFLADHAQGPWGTHWLGGRAIRSGKGIPSTVRDVLDQFCPIMDMTWRYNSDQDAVRLDFAWRKTDPRTSRQLLEVLLRSDTAELQMVSTVVRPGTSTLSFPHPEQERRYDRFFRTHQPEADDSWRIACNALMSQPDNFSRIWPLRMANDLQRGAYAPTVNPFTAKMQDENGGEHVLLIDLIPTEDSDGSGSFAYYLFTPEGKFERGGIYDTGGCYVSPSAWIDPTAKQLIVRLFMKNYSSKLDHCFSLIGSRLVLQSPEAGSWVLNGAKFLMHWPD